MTLVAALPMYDWPERRAEVDAQWPILRDTLRAGGFDAPDHLTRCNADLPAVPGGIKDAAGNIIAPDPATLPPDAFDLPTLWRHPALLITQTCWGPMELGLAAHVHVAGQDDYSGVAGGDDALYSSAIVMRRGEGLAVPAPRGSAPALPSISHMRGKRLAFNSRDSMSGYLGLQRDLAARGEGFDLFARLVESGGHRFSIETVASGRADFAAVFR